MQKKCEKIIKVVHFKLHETFSPQIRTDYPNGERPLKCSSIGWGYFTIPIKITFVDELEQEPITVEHELNFN